MSPTDQTPPTPTQTASPADPKQVVSNDNPPKDNQPSDEGKVPRSQVEKLSAELKKYKDAEAKRAEDEAIAKGEFDKVVSSKDQRIAELESQLSKAELTRKAESALKAANINPSVADILTDFVINEASKSETSIDEIIVKLMKEKPDLFNYKTEVGRSGLGTTTTSHSLAGATDNASLAEYIKSTESK